MSGKTVAAPHRIKSLFLSTSFYLKPNALCYPILDSLDPFLPTFQFCDFKTSLGHQSTDKMRISHSHFFHHHLKSAFIHLISFVYPTSVLRQEWSSLHNWGNEAQIVELITQGHSAGEWQSHVCKPDFLNPGFMSFSTLPCWPQVDGGLLFAPFPFHLCFKQ